MAAPQLTKYIQGQGSVSADNLNTFAQTCDVVAELRSLIGLPGMEVLVRGIDSVNDGGAGSFYWDAAGSGPDDGANVIVPIGAASGCWVRLTETGAGSGTTFSFPTTADLLTAFPLTVPLVDGTVALTAGRTSVGDDGGAEFYYNSQDKTTADNGGTIRVDDAGRRWYYIGDVISPELFGALAAGPPDEGNDDSGAIQAAINYLGTVGGTLKASLGKVYPIRYSLVVIGSNVTLDFTGATLYSDMGRSGRAAGPMINLGNSREWNLTTINNNRNGGNLTSDFINSGFTDTPLGTFPDDTSASLNCFYSKYFGGNINFYPDNDDPGTYGVQFNNCAGCEAYDYRTQYTGQGFGFGSDVAPNNPYAINCVVHDVTIEITNQIHTFYADGFFGYARKCDAWNIVCLEGTIDATPDGNLLAFSYSEDCNAWDVGGDCGRGSNGQGFLFSENTIRSKVFGGWVTRSKEAFNDFSPLAISQANGNAYIGGFADDTDYLITLGSHHCQFVDVRGVNVTTAEILTIDVNGAQNRIVDCDNNRTVAPAGQPSDFVIVNNAIEGRSGLRQVVVRPWDYVSPAYGSGVWNQPPGPHSAIFNTEASTTITMRVPLTQLANFTSITSMQFFSVIGASGMGVTSLVYSLVRTGDTPVTGNTSDSDAVITTSTFTPSGSGAENFVFNYGITTATLGDATYVGDVWLQIDVVNPVVGTTIKDGTVTGYAA